MRRASVKGSYRLNRSQVDGAALRDCVAILVPPRLARDSQMQVWGEWMLSHFMGRCWLGAALYRRIDDEAWLARLRALGALTAIPLVAVGDVWMHVRSRQPLQDVMTAIRLNKPVAECGYALQRNAARHLRQRSALGLLYGAVSYTHLTLPTKA